tara:strand:- start:257 stop:475 length:219 start_codon:yes stop_codon:yes gene_type:complete
MEKEKIYFTKTAKFLIFRDENGKELTRVKHFEHMTVDELYDEEAEVASKLSTNPFAKGYLDSIHEEMKRRSP